MNGYLEIATQDESTENLQTSKTSLFLRLILRIKYSAQNGMV